jgi:hypothetical protein
MASETIHPAATKRLEFITVSDPNDAKAAAIRTRVRKHVMKDIGRSRRRPKKQITSFELILNPQCQLGSQETDPFVQFPIEMGTTEKALLSSSMSVHVEIFTSLNKHAHRQPYSTTCILQIVHDSQKQTADCKQFFAMSTIPRELIDMNGFLSHCMTKQRFY